MMAVSMDAGGAGLTAGTPKLLFQGRFTNSLDRWYDVTADGQRFLMLQPQDTVRFTAAIAVVQEWSSELARLAPVARR